MLLYKQLHNNIMTARYPVTTVHLSLYLPISIYMGLFACYGGQIDLTKTLIKGCGLIVEVGLMLW